MQLNRSKHLKDFAVAVGIFVTLLVVVNYDLSQKHTNKFRIEDINPSSHAVIHQPDFYQRSSDSQPLDVPAGEVPSLTVAIALSEQFGNDHELEDLMIFDDELEKPLLKNGSGKCVGHETGGGQRTIGFEGSAANKMFEDMAPTLFQYRWTKGSFVELNYGKPSMRTLRLSLPLVPKQP